MARRSVTFAALCAGMFFVLLDVTIVNVALPAIRADLGSGPRALLWIVDADTLVFACLLISAGALGDRWGHRRAAIGGVLTFGAGSAWCALASSAPWLVAGRVVQGVGGAVLLPQTLAVLSTLFPAPADRARALGVWAGASSLALPAGPLLGGLLVGRWGWPSVFWVNVPVTVVAAVLIARAPETPRSSTRRFDLLGQLLVVVGLAAVVGGAIQSRLGLVGLGLVALAALIAVERRAREPLLPAWVVRRPAVAAGNAVAVLMNGGGGPTILLVTLLLQQAQHRTALGTAWWLLPGTLPLAVVAVPAGRLGARWGPRPLMAGGMAVAAVGALALVPAGGSSSAWAVVPGFALVGVGLALNTAPMVTAVLAASPVDRQALAAATNNAARQVGSAVGVAALGAVAGDPTRPGFAHGFGAAMLVVAALWALAAVVAVTNVS